MIIKKMPLKVIFICIAFALVLRPEQAIASSSFSISVEKTFTVSENGASTNISEKREISNQTSQYYIPTTSEEIFQIQIPRDSEQEYIDSIISSIQLHNEGLRDIEFSTTQGDSIEINAHYPKDVYPGTGQTFVLEYTVNHLTDKQGQVTNIFLPGLNEDFSNLEEQDNLESNTQYTYVLKVPENLGTVNFTDPIPTTTRTDNGLNIYTFDSTNQLVDRTIWQQLGTEQIYKFEIKQSTLKSDNVTPEQLDFLSKNIYKLVLPRDYDETNQSVYFSKIVPSPTEITIDEDGNAIATFLIDATNNSEITIEGYIKVNTSENSNSFNTSDYSELILDSYSTNSSLERYLQSTEYWESDSDLIIQKANELISNRTNILDILENDYNFVIDLIDYDELKFGSLNQRQGAEATLSGSNSVCMEYSDLLIALTRAQGIPSRAAYGYGYSSLSNTNTESDLSETHQWVQVWIPEQGWLTIDPTWGETGRKFIGPDLDHALWYVASEHPENPAPLEVFTSSNTIQLEPSEIRIQAVNELQDFNDLQTLEDLIEDSNQEKTIWTQLAENVQTTYAGRLVVVFIPICSSLFIVLIIISTIAKIIRKKRQIKK